MLSSIKNEAFLSVAMLPVRSGLLTVQMTLKDLLGKSLSNNPRKLKVWNSSLVMSLPSKASSHRSSFTTWCPASVPPQTVTATIPARTPSTWPIASTPSTRHPIVCQQRVCSRASLRSWAIFQASAAYPHALPSELVISMLLALSSQALHEAIRLHSTAASLTSLPYDIRRSLTKPTASQTFRRWSRKSWLRWVSRSSSSAPHSEAGIPII